MVVEIKFSPIFDNVKAHIKRHKVAYSLGAGIGIAGITAVIMRGNLRPMGGRVLSMPDGGLRNTASFSFMFRSPQIVNVTTVLDLGGRGHPGWPVKNIETNRLFFSQKQAADAFNIGEGALSKHLRGQFPDAHGLHFERVNLVPIQ